MEAKPVPIDPPPGVVKSETDRVAAGRFKDSQWIRFVSRKAQKRGGHSRQTTQATSGIPRAMHAWRSLNAKQYIGAGTYRKLYVYEPDFSQNDVTPIGSSGTLGNNPLTTTSGSAIVSVAHVNHGRREGDTVILAGASAVGGITPNGTRTVLLVTSANAYTFAFTSNASSSATGGGAAVTYQYEIGIGTELGAFGLGWGVGGYGLGTYGSEHESSTLAIEPRVWSIKNYGELMMAAYNGGTIFTFDPADLATNGRAEALSNAPDDVRAMFITEERYVFALCEDMLVKWPDQEDPTIWTPGDTVTANERRLTTGTKLVGGLPLVQGLSLVFSDAACYIFQYVGSSPFYSSRKVGDDCGLISPNAVCATSDGIAFWPSTRSFHYFDGSVHEVPNVDDIKDFVFSRINKTQPYLCWAYYDAAHQEVNFFYVLEGEDDPSFSVTYHIKDQCWTPNDWSDFPRASHTRFQQGESRPYLAGTDGHIYLHEDGYNADGAAIQTVLSLAPVAIEDGAQLMTIDGLRVDLQGQVGDVDIELEGFDNIREGTAAADSQTKTVSPTEDLVDFYVGGRYVGLHITSNEVDGYFRWGKPIALVRDNGMRR